MTPRKQPIQLSKEGRMSLAVASFQNNPYQTKRTLAAAFDVIHSTLRTRLRGILPRHETTPVNVKMSPLEEQSLVQWILDLDQRGFPPQIIDVRRMADVLLAARGQDPPPPRVGKNWLQYHDSSSASQSFRQSGIGNSTHNEPSVRILSGSAPGSSWWRTHASGTG
jgi:hypothetical protein